MNTHFLKEYYDRACGVAQEAGEKLYASSQTSLKIRVQTDSDVKIQADVESETFIRDALKITGLPIIGEEEGGDSGLLQQDVPYWIVDPLDGTYNFLRQQPAACVSIGLWQGQTPLIGAIYNFNTKALYSSCSEKGIFCNGSPIRPNWVKTKREACIFTGFPNKFRDSPETWNAWMEVARSYKKVRMIGSSALALAYVALGQGDIYFEDSIYLWDIAAGIALVHEAGGFYKISPLEEDPFCFKVSAAAHRAWL